MLVELFQLGGVLFWLLTIFSALWVIGFLSYSKTGKAVATILIYFAVLSAFTNADPIGFIKTNWLTILEYAAAYLAIGSLYMLVRWRILSGQVADVYEEARDSYLKRADLKAITSDADKRGVREAANGHHKMRKLRTSVPLMVRDNKARLTTWLTFWAFSAVEWIFGDLLVNLVNGIVKMFSGSMQRIANKQFDRFSELN